MLFPDGTLPSPRWRPFARGAAVCFGLLVVSAMFAPMGIDADHAVANPLGIAPVFNDLVLVMVALLGLVVTPGRCWP